MGDEFAAQQARVPDDDDDDDDDGSRTTRGRLGKRPEAGRLGRLKTPFFYPP